MEIASITPRVGGANKNANQIPRFFTDPSRGSADTYAVLHSILKYLLVTTSLARQRGSIAQFRSF